MKILNRDQIYIQLLEMIFLKIFVTNGNGIFDGSPLLNAGRDLQSRPRSKGFLIQKTKKHSWVLSTE